MLNTFMYKLTSMIAVKEKNKNTKPLPSHYVTKEQMAARLNVSGPTIDNWSRMGKLLPIKIGRRVYFDANMIVNNNS